MSCGIGLRRSLDLALLWLWYRPMATALIQPLAWEPPYAVGMALEKAKGQKKGGGGLYFHFALGQFLHWTSCECVPRGDVEHWGNRGAINFPEELIPDFGLFLGVEGRAF